MKTRRGNSYPFPGAPVTHKRKRVKLSSLFYNFFDMLPDDVVLSILIKLASSAESPADFISVLATCKRFNGLGLDPMVLSKGSVEMFAVKKWSEFAGRFLQRCSDAGSVEALYTLGMIQFYAFHNRRIGAGLMGQAAIRSHALALYSLAIIQFNGSGLPKTHKDLYGGVMLCARAASLGHVDAIRELGHCLRDGYGIAKNAAQGHRYLLAANARELASICSANSVSSVRSTGSISWPELISGRRLILPPIPYGVTSGFGVKIPAQKVHPANRFLVEWYANNGTVNPGYRMCSYDGCGRVETRMHEFRRCSVCGVMNYCSRGCQARDWTSRHHRNCRPMLRFPAVNAGES